MSDRPHDRPVTGQALEHGISSGSVCYLPCPVYASDLAHMGRIDELHLQYPFVGSRMLRDLLAGEDIVAGHLHVATLRRALIKLLAFGAANDSRLLIVMSRDEPSSLRTDRP